MLCLDAPASGRVIRRHPRGCRCDQCISLRCPHNCCCDDCIDRTLHEQLLWKRFENEELPLGEQIRRLAAWRKVDHTTIECIILLQAFLETVELMIKVGESRAEKVTSPYVTEVVPDHLEGLCRGACTFSDADGQQRRGQHALAELGAIGLTDREISVLSLLNEGHSQRETARLCGLTKSGVAHLLDRVKEKLERAGGSLDHVFDPPRPELHYVPTDQLAQLC